MATAAPTDGWAALEELAELSRMVHGGRRSVAQGAEQEQEEEEEDDDDDDDHHHHEDEELYLRSKGNRESGTRHHPRCFCVN